MFTFLVEVNPLESDSLIVIIRYITAFLHSLVQKNNTSTSPTVTKCNALRSAWKMFMYYIGYSAKIHKRVPILLVDMLYDVCLPKQNRGIQYDVLLFQLAGIRSNCLCCMSIISLDSLYGR